MFAALVLSGVLSVAPQLQPPQARPAPEPGERADAPFARLFQVPKPGEGEPQDRQLLPPQTDRRNQRTKIVCGTTLIIVGSEVDPDMPRPTPKEGVTYTMRRYPPPACGKDKEKER